MTPQRFNILLVDDTATDARLFELALREVAPRATVYWVATGEEALQALRKTDRFQDVTGVDIIILDLNMPGHDGLQTLEAIKKDSALKTKPVIVMSSSDARDDVRRSYELGASSYFVKPMTLEGTHDLVSCIARYWLEHSELPD